MKVFYTPKMVADSGCFSPSAAKPRQVVEDWAAAGLQLEIIEPNPATSVEFALAHDPRYVRDVLGCLVDNGFGNRSRQVADALPYTTGAFLSGARYVVKKLLDTRRAEIVAAPCSGFHHAGPHTAMGYCTFNGLMVTALALRKDYPNLRVGILDCDQHYGNGTDEIIEWKKSLDPDLFSTPWLVHHTVGELPMRADDAEAWLSTLPNTLAQLFSKDRIDVLLYQAGADPHVNDPYGGWLTTGQLHRRDRIVFEHLRRENIPCVWNLAGGYQYDEDGGIAPVLEIHRNTARAWFETCP